MQRSLERLRQRRREGLEGGFTLIELLIVIVILAILAAIVVFAVSNLTSSSAQASCRSDVQTAQTAAEAFKAQVGVYPGGTLPAGVTGPTAAPANLPATDSDATILDLMSQYTVGGNTVGPWLKTYPYNSGHYQIELDNGQTAGTGDVQVFNTATTPAELPAGGPFTYGPNDCTTVV